MRRVFLLLIFLCYGLYGAAQGFTQNPADTMEAHIERSLIAYYKRYPQEKAFLHTNQLLYGSGETIWYKAYVMAYGKPSALSRILYVQLSDTAGNVIAQNKLPLIDGKTQGNIEINQKIKSGWYRLTAFTSWMMNFDGEAWYRQQIYINNPADPVTSANHQPVAKKQYRISFYPEGGDMIEGAVAKIAFRAVDGDGNPINVKGIVKDHTNTDVAHFQTQHDGMGEWSFEVAGNSYSATIQFPDGTKREIKLPDVKKEGLSLEVAQTKSTIELKLVFAGAKERFGNCILAASQNSGEVITNQIKLVRGTNVYELANASFSTGILRLTVFSRDGIPLAERILFLNKHELDLSPLNADTLSFLAGARNSFSLTVKSRDGLPLKGNFSIAVTDADAFNKDETGQDIFSAMLVSPELKGSINDPGYYFKNENDSLASQLDLVMLTNGWRHFSWQKILNNETYPLRYPVETSQYIAGTIMNYKNTADDKDKFKVKLLIMNQDSSKFIGYIIPDSLGRFVVKGFEHTGFSDIYTQAADKKNHIKKIQIKFFESLADSIKKIKADAFMDQTDPGITSYFIAAIKNQARNDLMIKGILLRTVNIRGKRITPMQKLIDEHVSPKFETDNAHTLDLVNNPTANIGLINYMKGKFAGLQIYGDENSPIFIYRGAVSLRSTPITTNKPASQTIVSDTNSSLPFFYLDEARVDYFSVKVLSLNEIALVRYIPPPVWFAPYNGGNAGAVMIYTKKESDEVRKMNGMNDYDHYIFNGYSVTREFSEPDFVQLKQARLTDNRTTLYWNHDLDTDSHGVLKFGFHNSGQAKKFRIVVQGMDADGRLAYIEQSVQ
jgi:hypothetical protein